MLLNVRRALVSCVCGVRVCLRGAGAKSKLQTFVVAVFLWLIDDKGAWGGGVVVEVCCLGLQ